MGESRKRKWRNRRLILLMQVDESQLAATLKKSPVDTGLFFVLRVFYAGNNADTLKSSIDSRNHRRVIRRLFPLARYLVDHASAAT